MNHISNIILVSSSEVISLELPSDQTCLSKLEIIEKILDQLKPDIHYNEWIRVGAAIFNITQGSILGFAFFDEWRSKATKYKGKAARLTIPKGKNINKPLTQAWKAKNKTQHKQKQETFKIIPDLISNVNSKNIGKSKLEMLGFIVELEIKDHKDKDKVLDILFNNKSIKPGKELIKGSTVKLIYGSGDKGKPIELPDFVGMNVLLANLKASEIGLDLEINYSDSVVNLMDSNTRKTIVFVTKAR